MKMYLPTLFRLLALLAVLLSAAQPALPAAQAAAPVDSPQAAANPAAGEVLCLPGIYPADPGDCLPLGPSQARSEMAALDMSLPLRPLPARRLNPELAIVPYAYAELKAEATPIYATIEDAVAEQNPISSIAFGEMKYVTYTLRDDVNRVYQLRSGGYIRFSSVAQSWSVPTGFRGGLEFTQTPSHAFGWILPLQSSVETKHTPGYGFGEEDYTGRLVYQYQVVQIYTVQVVEGIEWYLIGPDEWIDQRYLGIVTPNTTPPQGVTNGRWIEVNLFEQTMAVYQDHQLVFATLIASGMEPFYTQPGLFPIYEKKETGPMAGAFEADRSDFYYLQDVPFTMYYDKARALHAAYWRHSLGFPQSHGCVNLSIIDAHWLFDWAQIGDWVYVWDPSGKTPTDPNYYKDGGA